MVMSPHPIFCGAGRERHALSLIPEDAGIYLAMVFMNYKSVSSAVRLFPAYFTDLSPFQRWDVASKCPKRGERQSKHFRRIAEPR